jgi:hypothetical protein
VTDGVAAKEPTVTFILKDKSGTPVPLSQIDRAALVLTGPTTELDRSRLDLKALRKNFIKKSTSRGSWVYTEPYLVSKMEILVNLGEDYVTP